MIKSSGVACLVATSMLVMPAPLRAEPVTATIAAATLVVSALGSIFGAKATKAAARARQQQFEATLLAIRSVDASVNANRALLEDVIRRVGSLTEDGERLRLHTNATSSGLHLYDLVAALTEADFQMEGFEEISAGSSLSAIIIDLRRANDFYASRLETGNDMLLLAHYAANADALFTAYHLQALYSTQDIERRSAIEASYVGGRGFLCDENNEEWDAIFGNSDGSVDCESAVYATALPPLSRALIQDTVIDSLETFRKVIRKNTAPDAPFQDQEKFLEASCDSARFSLHDEGTGHSAVVRRFAMPRYLQERHQGAEGILEGLHLSTGIFGSFPVPFSHGPLNYDLVFDSYGVVHAAWDATEGQILVSERTEAHFRPDYLIRTDGTLEVEATSEFPYPDWDDCEWLTDTNDFVFGTAFVDRSLDMSAFGMRQPDIPRLENPSLFETAEGRDMTSTMLSWLLDPYDGSPLQGPLMFKFEISTPDYSDVGNLLDEAAMRLRSSGVAAAIQARDSMITRADSLGFAVRR